MHRMGSKGLTSICQFKQLTLQRSLSHASAQSAVKKCLEVWGNATHCVHRLPSSINTALRLLGWRTLGNHAAKRILNAVNASCVNTWEDNTTCDYMKYLLTKNGNDWNS